MVRLHGRFTRPVADKVREWLGQLPGPTVVVDVSTLSFMDSSAFMALQAARALGEKQGRRMVFRGADGFAASIVELPELNRLLSDSVVPDEPAAVSSGPSADAVEA